MSGAIGSSMNSYGLLGTLIANSATVRQQLDTLTVQAGNGLIADTYAGLGSGAGVSLNLNPQVAALQNAQSNINAATGQMAVTQNAMTQDPGNRDEFRGEDAEPQWPEPVGDRQRRGRCARRAGTGRRPSGHEGRQHLRLQPARTPPTRQCRRPTTS